MSFALSPSKHTSTWQYTAQLKYDKAHSVSIINVIQAAFVIKRLCRKTAPTLI